MQLKDGTPKNWPATLNSLLICFEKEYLVELHVKISSNETRQN